MIEKLDLNDGRYKVILEKVNEIIDEVNRLTFKGEQLDEHTHTVLGEITSGPYKL